jgi:hypothetical protein
MSSRWLKKTVFLSLITAVICGVFLSCENPFTNNLGEKVDVEWPTITVQWPAPSSIIRGTVQFQGEATAYREVRRVEVRILNSNPNTNAEKPYLLDWTRLPDVSGGSTEKRWTYGLNTLDSSIFEDQEDGFLKIQFRASDPNLTIKDKNIQTYVYIIKNRPSEVKMSTPSENDLNVQAGGQETKRNIRGQIIDRRGIKPGFPRIKIWPAEITEPLGDAFPDMNGDPNDWTWGGWATLFLDDPKYDHTGELVPGDWSYVDRSQMEVVNQAPFSFKLAAFNIVETPDSGGYTIREARYIEDTGTGDFIRLPVGKYKFRIQVSDTYFYTNQEVKEDPLLKYKYPRNPKEGEEEIVGYKPEANGMPENEDEGSFWYLDVKSTGQNPEIETDNSDIPQSLLDETPNIYITESSSKKILTGDSSRNAFRLRVRVSHPNGLFSCTLKWTQPGSGNPGGALAWTVAPSLPSPVPEQIFEFTAKEGSPFVSSLRPYSLEVEAVPMGDLPDRVARKTYSVTVSNTIPKVRIDSVTGAYSESAAASSDYYMNYTVNGNIRVDTSTDADGDMVKWIVEPASSSAILTAINTYNTTPNADNLKFFNNNISDSVTPSANATGGRVAADGTLRFNTTPYDGQDLWLYVIAQDSVQKLGYIRIKLHVDESTDLPEMPESGLSLVSSTSTSTSANPITGPNDLFIQINSNKTQMNPEQVRRNVIDKDTGIDLSFKDDDGIRPSGITMTLTNLNTSKSVQIPTADIATILGGGVNDSRREWAGMLTQRIMATQMEGNGTNLYLRDGIYRLEIIYRDDAAAKVTILGTTVASVPGDSKTFFFCVMSDQPTITITSPGKNEYVNVQDPVDITGTVTSRIPIQRLWISFNPNLTATAGGEETLFISPYSNPASFTNPNAALNNTTGNYVYYWHKESVQFGATTSPTTSEDRGFTLEAAHNLGGFVSEDWSVKVDTEKPVVALERFFFDRPLEADRTTHRVNGKFNFIISATDNNGIKQTGNNIHVKWWIVRNGETPPTGYNYPVGTNIYRGGQFTIADKKEAGYERHVNSTITAANLTNGTYKLYYAAEDRAGNLSDFTVLQPFEFEVDQDADYPVVNEGDIVPNGDVRPKANLKITGKVTDDDGFKDSSGAANFTTSTVQIRFRTNANNNAWGAWRDISSGAAGSKVELDPTGALAFEYVIPATDTYFAADGEKQYQIRVTDIQANKNPGGTASPNDGNIGTINRTFPTGSPDYYSFILKDTKPDIIFYRYDENTAHSGMGQNSTYPATPRPVFKSRADLLTALLAGLVKDKYLASVTVKFDHDGTEVELLDTNGVSGTYTSGTDEQLNWQLYGSDIAHWLPTNFDTAAVAQGLHYVIISARDIAGNSVSAEWRFYKDTTGPVISLSNITEESSPTQPLRSAMPVVSVTTGSVTITGRFDDDYSNIQSATYQFDGSGISGNITIGAPAAKTKNWTIPIPNNTPAGTFPDGIHYFTVTVTDALGNPTTKDKLWFVVDRANPTLTSASDMDIAAGSGGLGEGFNATTLKTDENQRVFAAATANATSETIIFTLSGTAKDENLSDMTFALRSGSSGNTPLVTFSLATLLPEWGAATGSYYSADTDVTTPKRLTVTKNTAANTWNWTLNILEKDLAALRNELGSAKSQPCFVTLNARDLAGRDAGAQHWRFYLDTEKPVIEFSNFAASGSTVFESNDVALSGTVSDDSRVKTIQYYLSRYNYVTGNWEFCNATSLGDWHATDDHVWTNYVIDSPGSLVSWTLDKTKLNIPFTTYGSDVLDKEGRYRLYIRAADYSLGAGGAGNLTGDADNVKEFYVDRSDPVLAWTGDNKDKIFFRNISTNSIESLSFTARDINYTWNPLDTGYTAGDFALSIKQPNNAVWNATIPSSQVVFGQRTLLLGAYQQTITIKPEIGTGNWAAGRYTVTLTVKDRAGKTATLSRDITVDNTAPAITINDEPSTTVNAAITGKYDFRGVFTKTTGTSPVVFVAFNVAQNGSTATPSGLPGVDVDLDFTSPSGMLTLAGAGWRFDAGGNNRLVGSSNNTLMLIDPGLTNVNMMIPNTTSLYLNTPMYTGTNNTITTGVKFDGKDIPSGDSINKLVIHFLAVDEAGNRNLKTYEYWIYPEGDRPTVTVTSPNDQEPEGTRLINSSFRIGGNAKDNFRVKNVWFRILGNGNMTTPFTKDDKVSVPVWNEAWEQTSEIQTAQTLTEGSTSYGSGWFKASGGGRADVPWYAYINTNGELDPPVEGSRQIIIEVLAEDYQYNDEGIVDTSGNGLYTNFTKVKRVTATVVKGRPEFSNERIKRSASGLSSSVGIHQLNFSDGSWLPVDEANMRKRAAYAITVTHEMGLKDITWTPKGENPIDLLNAGLLYNTTTYYAELNNMSKLVPDGTGIAVKAGPKNIKTGPSQNLTAGTKYLIWKWNRNDAPTQLTAPGTGLIPNYNDYPVDADMRFIIVTPTSTLSSVNLGNNELMEANAIGADGKFEWVVVVDVHADLIENGNYKYVAGGPGPYSVRSPVALRATENSRSVPLYTNYTAELPIDNQPPAAMYSHNGNVAGQAATFGGEAGDNGPVNGLDKVVLWFSRKNASNADIPLSWHERAGGSPSVPAQSFVGGGTVPEGIPLTSAQMPKDFNESDTSGNYDSIVIKYNDPLGQNARFGHKLPIGFANVGGELNTSWYVTLDSTLIVSGRITAHYIVYDKAGNTTYYTTTLIVKNDVPLITRITLATDIRGDNTLTTTPFNGNKTFGVGRSDAADLVTSPFTTIGTAMNSASNATDAQKGISAPIAVNTSNVRRYGVVYDEAFNVRNNLLAVKVEVAQDQGGGGKDRTFRVEYVSGANLLQGNDFYKSIRAGRIYMINNPGNSGVNSFPWGKFGAQGNPERGLAFMAVIDGNLPENFVADINYGSPSVWELNSYYYNDPDPLKRNRVPTALGLSDVNYSNAVHATNGKSAEFVYAGTGTDRAFNATQFDAGGSLNNTAGNIRDFTPTIPANSDGRPAAYPAFAGTENGNNTSAAYPWAAHSLFIVRVFGGVESDLFGDFALLSIRVNNNDRTRPYAQVYDLNPKTEGQDTALSGANDAARRLTALQPAMGTNRTKGGLYNTGTTARVAKSGHVEPRNRIVSGGGYSHTLTSAQMGGAVSATQATITKPFANPANFFDVDTVSGEVILRGYVEDDQRIAGVTLTFAGAATTPVNILERTPGAFALRVPNNANTNGRVAFFETIDLNRHRVEWAYLWNTETIPGGASVVRTGLNVTATAYIANATLGQKTENPSDEIQLGAAVSNRYNHFNPDYALTMPRYNRIGVNLRPYITGFLRNQSTFAHNTRSRQGRYMFARNETAVVTGFNLFVTGQNTVINLPGMGDFTTAAVGTTVGGVNFTIGNFGIATASDIHYRQFTVNNNTATTTTTTNNGLVTLTVNNLAAVNTSAERRGTAQQGTTGTLTAPAKPRAILPWNIERSPGVDGSDLWDDFTQVHIWQSNDNAPGTNQNTVANTSGRFPSRDSSLIYNPAMSIDPVTGILYESHNASGGTDSGTDWYNTGRTIRNSITVSGNGTTDLYPVTQFSDPIFFSDVYRSPGTTGIAADTWAVSSIIGRSGTLQFWRGLGGIYIHGPGGGPIAFTGGGTGSTNGAPSNQDSTYSSSLYYGESTWYNSSNYSVGVKDPPPTDQFMNPHIVTSYAAINGTMREHIHVSYYDDEDGSIKYRYNRRSPNGSIYTGTIDGGNANDGAAVTANNAIPRMWVNLDGGLDGEDMALTAYTHTDIGTGNIAENARVVKYTAGASSNINYTLLQANINIAITGTNYFLRERLVNVNDYVSKGTPLFRVGSATRNTTTNITTIFAPVSGTVSGTAMTGDIPAAGVFTTNLNTGTILTINSTESASIAATKAARGDIRAGKHNSIAVASGGRPVIAYYDESNQRLKLAVSDRPDPILAANWVINEYVIPSADLSRFPGTGEFVSMKIDTTVTPNIVHIAAMNSTYNSLVYIKGQLSGTSYTNVSVQVVDSVGNVGRWCALSLDENGNPWISYMDNRYLYGRDGVKVAYLNTTIFYKKGTENIDMYGESLEGWETMNVPTTYRVENPVAGPSEHGRLGMECFPTRNVDATTTRFWGAAVGYLSRDAAGTNAAMDRYRVAYYVK